MLVSFGFFYPELTEFDATNCLLRLPYPLALAMVLLLDSLGLQSLLKTNSTPVIIKVVTWGYLPRLYAAMVYLYSLIQGVRGFNLI